MKDVAFERLEKRTKELVTENTGLKGKIADLTFKKKRKGDSIADTLESLKIENLEEEKESYQIELEELYDLLEELSSKNGE